MLFSPILLCKPRLKIFTSNTQYKNTLSRRITHHMFYRLIAVLPHNLFAFSWYEVDNYPPFSLRCVFSHLEKHLYGGKTQHDQKVCKHIQDFSTPSPKLCIPQVFLATLLLICNYHAFCNHLLLPNEKLESSDCNVILNNYICTSHSNQINQNVSIFILLIS